MAEGRTPSIDEVLGDFATRIAVAVRAIAPKEPVEIAQANAVAFSTYWRLVRYFDAEVLLIRNGLPEEAYALARSSFEDSLRLAELEGAGNGRASFELQWILDSYAEQESLMKESQSRGMRSKQGAPSDAEVMEKIKERKTGLEEYRQRTGVGRLRAFSQVKDAAKAFGRDDEYWSYRFSHNMVHGSDVAQMYFKIPIDGGIAALDRTWTPALRLAIFEIAVTSTLRGAQSMARMFGFAGLQPLIDLEMELEQTIKGFE